jgi:CRISPR-associated protein Cpf1
MTDFSQFTNLYQLQKTLRFELIPQGKTLEFIEMGLSEVRKHAGACYLICWTRSPY